VIIFAIANKAFENDTEKAELYSIKKQPQDDKVD